MTSVLGGINVRCWFTLWFMQGCRYQSSQFNFDSARIPLLKNWAFVSRVVFLRTVPQEIISLLILGQNDPDPKMPYGVQEISMRRKISANKWTKMLRAVMASPPKRAQGSWWRREEIDFSEPLFVRRIAGYTREMSMLRRLRLLSLKISCDIIKMWSSQVSSCHVQYIISAASTDTIQLDRLLAD